MELGRMTDSTALYYERTNALVRMLRTSNLTTGVFERATGVHIAQWRILAFLSQHPDCTQKQLKDAHRVDPAAITRSVKLLERSGLVARRTDAKDNRLTRVILTPAGEKRVAEVSELRRLYLREALQGIAPKDLDVFETVLIALEANAVAMNRRMQSK
jgi:DNA-binding MarR family transcriptional regulator